MGWSFSLGWNSRNDLVDHFRKPGFWNEGVERVADAVVGNHYWALLEKDGVSSIWLGLMSGAGGEGWGYKGMSESAGPYYYDCPKSLIERASFTDDPETANWRSQVLAYHESRKNRPEPVSGMVLGMADGRRFTLEYALGPRKGWALSAEDGTLYRMSSKGINEMLRQTGELAPVQPPVDPNGLLARERLLQLARTTGRIVDRPDRPELTQYVRDTIQQEEQDRARAVLAAETAVHAGHGADHGQLFWHPVAKDRVQDILDNGLPPGSILVVRRDVADAYAQNVADVAEGDPVLLQVSLDDEAIASLAPDEQSLQDPQEFILGMSEDDVASRWEDLVEEGRSDGRACLELVGSACTTMALPAQDLLVISPETGFAPMAIDDYVDFYVMPQEERFGERQRV